MTESLVRSAATPAATRPSPWAERVALTNFRNYQRAVLNLAPGPVVLTGDNGAGKTNLLEAVSLLAAGQGLRRAPYPELARAGGDGGWAVAARLHASHGTIEIGTGINAGEAGVNAGRIVRIDQQPQPGSGVLADHVEMVWLTPAMDGLFSGPAGDRRRFLDRLILCFDPGYRTRVGQFERAMRQRNRLLELQRGRPSEFDGLETVMAETGVAIAAARAEAVARMAATIELGRRAEPGSPFPWARIALDGWLEDELSQRPAVEVEDVYLRRLQATRDRDRTAGRTLDGPHRCDLLVEHGPKSMPAKQCSTGEQKALLIGLVLAHAELVAAQKGGAAPILLLDEIAAHLDERRRSALFEEIRRLGAQAFMTGTDRSAFASLEQTALFLRVEEGTVLATEWGGAIGCG